MRRILNKILLLMLIISIGIANVSAVSLIQSLTLDTHTAGGYNYIDAVATTTGVGKITFILDSNSKAIDWSIVEGTNVKTYRDYMGNSDITGQKTTPFVVGSNHEICVVNTIDNTDKLCKTITIPSQTTELSVTKLDLKRDEDGYVTATIFYTGTGIINVMYDNIIDQKTVSTPDSYTTMKLITPLNNPGAYKICAYNGNTGIGEQCKSININTKYNLQLSNLYLKNIGEIGEGWVTVDVTTSGFGTLGISIDNVLKETKIITQQDINYGSQFQTTTGIHTFCVYDFIVEYNPTNICREINVSFIDNSTILNDKEKPTIISVALEPEYIYENTYITVTVSVIDNVKVAEVTSDGTKMTFYKNPSVDEYWISKVLAVKGTHIIKIIAKDSAGNIANEEISYTTSIHSPVIEAKTYTTNGLIPLETSNIKQEVKKNTFGKLFVDSFPNNASIHLNGVYVGLTAKSLDVSTGGYEVKVSKVGYEDYIKKIIILESNTFELVMNLTKLNSTTTTNGAEISYKELSLNGEFPNKNTNPIENNITTTTQQETPKNSLISIALLVLALSIIAFLLYNKYYNSFGNENVDKSENIDKHENGMIEHLKDLFRK